MIIIYIHASVVASRTKPLSPQITGVGHLYLPHEKTNLLPSSFLLSPSIPSHWTCVLPCSRYRGRIKEFGTPCRLNIHLEKERSSGGEWRWDGWKWLKCRLEKRRISWKVSSCVLLCLENVASWITLFSFSSPHMQVHALACAYRHKTHEY